MYPGAMPMRQPPVRVLAFARRDHARAIRADQPGFPAPQGLFDLHHVIDRDAFRDADDQVQPGVGRFQNGVGGEGRRDENGGDRCAGLAGGVADGVKDGNFFAGVLEDLAAFAGGDAGDDPGAVIEGKLGVPGAKTAGDALDEDFGVGLTSMDIKSFGAAPAFGFGLVFDRAQETQRPQVFVFPAPLSWLRSGRPMKAPGRLQRKVA